jgi:hypothetical protein
LASFARLPSTKTWVAGTTGIHVASVELFEDDRLRRNRSRDSSRARLDGLRRHGADGPASITAESATTTAATTQFLDEIIFSTKSFDAHHHAH